MVEPGLADLRDDAEALLQQINNGEQTERDRLSAQDRLVQFFQQVRRAQLSDSHWLLGWQKIGNDPRPVREATAAALAMVGRIDRDASGSPEAWHRLAPPHVLSPAEAVDFELACRELVLLWVEATAQAAPGEDPVVQARRGLALLDRSEGDEAGSKASFLLRARLHQQSGSSSRVSDDRLRADSIPARDAVDRVAAGREFQLVREWSRAIAEYEAALQLDANQFRAQLCLAICQLQAGNPDAARAGLTTCLQRQPKSIDLLLLRGVASGESAGRLLGQTAEKGKSVMGADARSMFDNAESDFASVLDLQPTDRNRSACGRPRNCPGPSGSFP